MSSWYKLALGNDDEAFEPALRIQQMFMSKFLMCPPGSGRALFSCYDKQHDNLWLYFSPAAEDIALRVYAKPCKPPTALECIGLLAGEGDALGGSVEFPLLKKAA
ncbi:hypothetical protein KYG_14893 [Acidovorax sp. NO-1]|uniref:hypothetical protein n=1 Tax=Acidovorax sp. NO-1 TaxID=512030 RepID=UPI00023FD1DC|nr:hypothetical protein [Acidovorax sp. NO-1]EHL22049.1 hypothetical protein KYG_14893 [Acidovorax sp. NO-1]